MPNVAIPEISGTLNQRGKTAEQIAARFCELRKFDVVSPGLQLLRSAGAKVREWDPSHPECQAAEVMWLTRFEEGMTPLLERVIAALDTHGKKYVPVRKHISIRQGDPLTKEEKELLIFLRTNTLESANNVFGGVYYKLSHINRKLTGEKSWSAKKAMETYFETPQVSTRWIQANQKEDDDWKKFLGMQLRTCRKTQGLTIIEVSKRLSAVEEMKLPGLLAAAGIPQVNGDSDSLREVLSRVEAGSSKTGVAFLEGLTQVLNVSEKTVQTWLVSAPEHWKQLLRENPQYGSKKLFPALQALESGEAKKTPVEASPKEEVSPLSVFEAPEEKTEPPAPVERLGEQVPPNQPKPLKIAVVGAQDRAIAREFQRGFGRHKVEFFDADKPRQLGNPRGFDLAIPLNRLSHATWESFKHIPTPTLLNDQAGVRTVNGLRRWLALYDNGVLGLIPVASEVN